jgi:hypothetical protein
VRTSDINHQLLGTPRQGLVRPRKIGLLRPPHIQQDLSGARDAAGRPINDPTQPTTETSPTPRYSSDTQRRRTPVPLSEVTGIDVDGVYALGVSSGGAGESDIPFCLSGVQGVAVLDALAEAELTELFEVFSSITRRGRSLTKGRCQRYWSTLLTRFRRGCLLGVLAVETTRRMIAIPWQIVPFRDRVRARWRCWGPRPAGRPRSPGSVSGRGSTTDGHSVRLKPS